MKQWIILFVFLTIQIAEVKKLLTFPRCLGEPFSPNLPPVIITKPLSQISGEKPDTKYTRFKIKKNWKYFTRYFFPSCNLRKTNWWQNLLSHSQQGLEITVMVPTAIYNRDIMSSSVSTPRTLLFCPGSVITIIRLDRGSHTHCFRRMC